MVAEISCKAAADGSIDLTVTGGTTSYSYSWSNGTTTVGGQSLAASYISRAETWTCTVTPNDGDEDGTSVSTSVTATNCFAGWDESQVALADACGIGGRGKAARGARNGMS